jgi:4-hydroxy-4-methyl-2-oxoglutarate aldolase
VTTAIEALARLGSATVYEATGQRGLVDGEWYQIVPGSRVAGPARTVRCGQGDNLMAHELLTRIRPGDVLVLTMPKPAPFALVGDLMVTQAKAQGAAALLVDAAVRDVEELVSTGLPIWARYISIRGTTKELLGTIDEPVTVGGQIIASGDIVVMDRDGVAVVPQARIGESLALSRKREAKESEAKRLLANGATTHQIYGFGERVRLAASHARRGPIRPDEVLPAEIGSSDASEDALSGES